MKYKNTIFKRFYAINLSGSNLFGLILNNLTPDPSPLGEWRKNDKQNIGLLGKWVILNLES